MKKTITIFIFCVQYFYLFAQQGVVVEYNWININNKNVNHKVQLAANDSISYFWIITKAKEKDIIKNNNPFGSFYTNHIVYTNHKTKIYQTAFQTSKKKYITIVDSIIKTDWLFSNETKVILGYTCKRAGILQNDTVVKECWYTDSLGVRGSIFFSNIPGLALEENDYNGGLSIKATKITKQNVEIIEPKKDKVMDRKEFRVWNDKRKSQMPQNRIIII